MSEEQPLQAKTERQLWQGWTIAHAQKLTEWRNRAGPAIGFVPNAEALGFPVVMSVVCVPQTAFVFAETEGFFELSRIKRVKGKTHANCDYEADWWGLKIIG